MQGWSCRQVVAACQQLRQVRMKSSMLKNAATSQPHAGLESATTLTSNKIQASLPLAVSKHTSSRHAYSQLPARTSTTDTFSYQVLAQIQASVQQLSRRHSKVSSAWQQQQTLQHKDCCRTSAFSTTQGAYVAPICSKLKLQVSTRLPGLPAASLAAHQPKAGWCCKRMYSTAASSKGKHAGGPQQVDVVALAKARKLAVPVGVLAGVFGSFVGVGGGVLIVPMLTGACKALPQRLVSGTSLVAVVSTALASSYTYLSHGVVDTAAALLISCCAVLTAPLGANLTATLNAQALKKILGYFLIAVAFLVPLKSFLFQDRQTSLAPKQPRPETTDTSPPDPPAAISLPQMVSSATAGLKAMSWTTTIMLGMTGATAGVASGLLGIGGGTVVTPLLAIATPLSQAGVLGSSLLAMVPPSCAGLVQHARLGNVDWRMAAGLAAGTAVGSFAGSKVAVNAPTGMLEGIFSVGMLFLGWRTLIGARQAQLKAMPRIKS